MSKGEYLNQSLLEWLSERGFSPAQEPASYAPLQPDMVLKSGKHLLLVEAKVAGAYRSMVYPALVGDLILRAKHVPNDASNVDIMLALLVKQINEKAVNDLERYAAEYFPSLNWFLIDEHGNGAACLNGQRYNPFEGRTIAHYSERSVASRSQVRLFSPSSQWLLKLLLLPGIDPRFWGGPHDRPKSIVKLAEAAKVAQSLASSFVKRFEEAGYIKRKDGEPIIVRHRDLLDDWFYALKLEARNDVAMRSMHGESIDQIIEKIPVKYGGQAVQPAIVGYHLACHLHGLGRSSVRSAMIYAREPSQEVVEGLGLVPDESDSPALWLVSRDIKSVVKGSVIAEGIPVSDILQCYLDVRASRARGQEQADYILDNVLLPHFERRD
jgi:hypothetical protein